MARRSRRRIDSRTLTTVTWGQSRRARRARPPHRGCRCNRVRCRRDTKWQAVLVRTPSLTPEAEPYAVTSSTMCAEPSAYAFPRVAPSHRAPSHRHVASNHPPHRAPCGPSRARTTKEPRRPTSASKQTNPTKRDPLQTAGQHRVVRPAPTMPQEREFAVAIASRFCHEESEARHALNSPSR